VLSQSCCPFTRVSKHAARSPYARTTDHRHEPTLLLSIAIILLVSRGGRNLWHDSNVYCACRRPALCRDIPLGRAAFPTFEGSDSRSVVCKLCLTMTFSMAVSNLVRQFTASGPPPQSSADMSDDDEHARRGPAGRGTRGGPAAF
jgi:hypothetical protein